MFDWKGFVKMWVAYAEKGVAKVRLSGVTDRANERRQSCVRSWSGGVSARRLVGVGQIVHAAVAA